jgi:predicted 3-demethylubiquinone-9 3-methyltransferase (glyoxalase superfamily)
MSTSSPSSVRVTPCLWFNDNLEEAFALYAGLFDDARLSRELSNPDGSLLSATMHLAGQDLMVINAPSELRFNESASLFVSCPSQAEVDRLWSGLIADGGAESQCGWLRDRFGLSWQIVPTRLGELLGDPDPVKADRVMQAMLRMRKVDVPQLEAAYAGRPDDFAG